MLHAVDDVSFTIKERETLGVVGESGCGKSTLGRVVLKLLEPTDGRIVFEGKDITNISEKENIELRRKMQIIFQDPYSSLNPRLCVSELIADPLKVFKLYSAADRQKKVLELMDLVGLARRYAYSYPHELDGGRRQRIGIAKGAFSGSEIHCVRRTGIRAGRVDPGADIESAAGSAGTEGADVHLCHPQHVGREAYLHKHSGDVCGGHGGEKPGEGALQAAAAPDTKGLLAAIPVPSIDREKKRVELMGELSSPIEPKNECRFAARCRYATEICRKQMPTYEEVLPNHFVSCHNVREINKLSLESASS
jgi:peptide/nickel transport system ATP-binding protein